MELVDYTDDDLDLSVALETDPAVMAELGGPRPLEEIERVHPTRVMPLDHGGLWFKIIPELGSDEVAGALGVWRSTVEDTELWETGWMLLPRFHGRGIGSRALSLLMDRVRGEPRFDAVHAYPGTANGPSNGICRKNGFELVGTVEVEYRGNPMTCNHWVWRRE